ncbi:MAG: DUF4384 domain-containing protein [Reichenbachiella sp.]
MLRLLFCTFLILMVGESYAQGKDWIQYQSRQRNYPATEYFTGFMSKYLDKNDNLDREQGDIVQQAKVQLSESIRISIESKIINKMSNVNTVSLEEFEKVSQSYSQISVAGLNTDYYIDPRKKEILGFAWVEKSKVTAYYTDLVRFTLQEIVEIDLLGTDLIPSNPSEALELFYSSNKLFKQIEEAQSILIICGVNDLEILLKNEAKELKRSIAKKAETIRSNKDLTLTELSAFLITSLKIQVGTIDEKIQVSHVTYRDSGIGSEFSERFSSLLVQELTDEGFIVAGSEPFAGPSKEKYVLSGTYWEDGDKGLQIGLVLHRMEEDNSLTIIAGADGWSTLNELMNLRLDYKPVNYFESVEKEKLFNTEAVINGGAKLELWTNKGDEGLIYKEGEKLRLLIRMNKTGYVRLVNHWADGTQVLLLDNYYIDYRKVNRILRLPLEWEVTCPCGVEFVQASAQSIEFVPLDTKLEDGFSYIENEASDVITRNRSKNEAAVISGGFAVEKRLVLATLD